MSQDFDWSKQYVIVTGGRGFLGAHLCAHLAELGCGTVVALGSKDYDLREQANVKRLFADHPDATQVVHLAATVGGIGANSKYPGTFFYDNLVMGVMLMEHARRAGVPKFVGVGTICSYPKFTPVPFKEDDLWNGYPEETNAPYGLAKKMLLVQAQAYRQEFGYNAVHLLPVNLYGPGDEFDPEYSHVIPAIIKKVYDAQQAGASEIVLWGDGSPTRDFFYVKDAARAIALAMAHYDDPEPVNLGTGVETSIRELAETIVDVMGFQGELRWDTSKPNGQPRRALDTSRAEARFGFRAGTSLRDGLKPTIAWYREARARGDAP